MTAKEAADARGVTLAAASVWARRKGRKFKPGKRRFPPRADYAALAAAGLTVAEAAQKAGVSASAISRWSIRHGVYFCNSRSYILDGLGPHERTEYDALMRAGFRSSESLAAIGRTDLVQQ